MNVLADSRSGGWWSTDIFQSESLRVLMDDLNVVHDSSLRAGTISEDILDTLTRVSDEDVPMWEIIRIEWVPTLVVLESTCAIKSTLFALGRTRKTASMNWSLMFHSR